MGKSLKEQLNMKKSKDAGMAAANDNTEAPALVGATVPKVMDEIKAKKKRLPNVVRTEEQRTIHVDYKYTPKEIAALSQTMAQTQIELSEVQEEKKSVMASFTERIKGKQVNITKLSRQVRDGYEKREHSCTLILDFKKKQKRYEDNLTKKVIKVEAFSPGDEQRRFV